MAQEQVRALRKYFAADDQKKFYYEGIVGRGGQATIYKVKYVRPGGDLNTARSLVLKIANPKRGSDVQETIREKEILMDLRGCKHIVRCIVGPGDSLAPASAERNWAWIYLDRIENGTLTGFMNRAKQNGMVRLPNRVLWPIFLCLVRACIAMAWPRNAEDLNESIVRTLAPPSGLTHNDIHGDNLLFGSYLDHPEHGRTPILKLIDFGLAARM
ncbi:kinase-like domain-containing protein [Rostrohypoxylon terebratum]|nr:kinase-like domain-containing protein [Rostrohypoxylon terebratum]